MKHSTFEIEAHKEIELWEKSLDYEGNDFEKTYERWLDHAYESLPEQWKENITRSVDQWIFHIYAMFNESSIQKDAKERILATAKAFDERVRTFEDLKVLSLPQLKYIAEQEQSRHSLYSVLQGGLIGTGRTILSTMSIPATLMTNIRVVQLLSYVYGYDLASPYELMTSLKVFHAATLPKRYQGYAWNSLKKDLIRHNQSSYFYNGDERVITKEWLELAIHELVKLLAIQLFRPKKEGKLPLLSIVIGVNFQYRLSKKVSTFANKYYLYRYLTEQKN